MSLDPRLIAELRELFKAGATPSRLLRLIVARHDGEPTRDLDRLVRAYMREAFCVSMFRASVSMLTNPSEELPFALINASIIHQIVERRAEWDRDAAVGTTWLDSLEATDEGLLVDCAIPQEFVPIWDQLDDAAKLYLKRLIGNAQHLNEKVGILSKLVEQLQEQVIALEGPTAEPRPRTGDLEIAERYRKPA